jgi:DNA-binding beta-propeller fold protein YncE
MASGKKKSQKRSSALARSPMVAVPEPKQTKNTARILIAIVLVIFAYYAFDTLKGNGKLFMGEAPKDWKVQLLAHITGEQQPCGAFVAWGVAPIGKNDVAVADNQHNRILIFDRKGKYLKTIGKSGAGPKEFHEPSGMVSDGKGQIFVMDTWNGAIKGLNENGQFVLNLDFTKVGSFFGPRGLAWDGKNFAVPDPGHDRVALLSPQGDLVASWGKKGKDAGDFSVPAAVTLDKNGNYLVAESGNHRLQWLDGTGKSIKIVKYDSEVTMVAVDKEGRYYVGTNEDDGCVKAYNPEGKYLGNLKDQDGSGAAFRGARWMLATADDVLMVTSADNSVYLYQLPSSQEKGI